jgi:hypothetical protein
MPNVPAQSTSAFLGGSSGNQLLIDVSTWLTVNGMKSENMQFRMLCQQSIDNVPRKVAFQLLKDHYKELTRKAFAGRAKELAAVTAAAASQKAGKIINDIEGMFGGNRKLFADDIVEIESVINPAAGGGASASIQPIGFEKIQRCLDILGERINYTVLNNIPTPRPLSETIRHDLQRNEAFLTREYDRAVVGKIMTVLQNSENLSKSKFGNQAPADDEAEHSHELQREQVAEEEVLQEQEEEEEEEEEEEDEEGEEGEELPESGGCFNTRLYQNSWISFDTKRFCIWAPASFKCLPMYDNSSCAYFFTAVFVACCACLHQPWLA